MDDKKADVAMGQVRRYAYLALFICICVSVRVLGKQPLYRDQPFWQDHSQKLPMDSSLGDVKLKTVHCDRNGRVLVLSDKGLLKPYQGRLVADRMHRPLLDMFLKDFAVHQGQFVYLTNETVLSNAWAGRLRIEHNIKGASSFVMGSEQTCLIANRDKLVYYRDGHQVDSESIPGGRPHQLAYDRQRTRFLLLTENGLYFYTPSLGIHLAYHGSDVQCFALSDDGGTLWIGITSGCQSLDPQTFKPKTDMKNRLPWPDITCQCVLGDKLWCGTARGAFAIGKNDHVDYYASQRWLLDDVVLDIAPGPDRSILILTQTGLNVIRFQETTLAQKAEHFDRLTRQRHIRYGFNSKLALSRPGDLSSGSLVDQDNDGLWTAMYLAGECFRYTVTQSKESLANCYESFDAMERLIDISEIPGFPARSFERTGYQVADLSRWRSQEGKPWTWKGTTSSDEIVGHFFAYTIFAETIKDRAWRQRAIDLMAAIMDHIIENDWYLIGSDGKPTQWGRWHPEYVNQFPRAVGDRRLNSVEIISFLQATYHFTQKEIYRDKAYELMDQHGYLDNINIPASEIGYVPGEDLATDWNHSDDELAFLSYWNLYRYPFTEALREQYRKTIRGHWLLERPEKNPLWTFIYADTGAQDIDLEEAIWTLREFPLDMISWSITNSHRRDLTFLEENFRRQSTATVLPPDERPMSKHNNNAFRLDGGVGGRREYSGDIYLLPYWMGRYLSLIK